MGVTILVPQLSTTEWDLQLTMKINGNLATPISKSANNLRYSTQTRCGVHKKERVLYRATSSIFVIIKVARERYLEAIQ